MNYWQREGRWRLIPASIILGIWLSQVAVVGAFSLRRVIIYFPISATIGCIIGAMISPLIAMCLWRKPFGPALLAAYTPATIVALFSATALEILSIPITALTLAASSIFTMFAMPNHTPAGHCPSCNYDLANLLTPQCPECGKPLDTHPLPTTPSSGTDL